MALEYSIIRSKRKTVTVSVSTNNTITVRCPLSMSDAEIRSFIDIKSGWIYKVLAENKAKRAGNESILSYKEVYIEGQKFPLIFADRNRIDNGAVYVKNISSIKKTLTKYLSADLISFANAIASQIKLRAIGFSIRSYKSRWGCCDRKGQITLNSLVIMLPRYLQRYVIIHELCHTVHFNHSQKFWDLVAKFEPNYMLCRKNLKSFNYLTRLY